MIAVGEIWHLQGSFQGALGLDNCVRYICNRPCLYLTEEHLIRWEFCLVNQKLFHLIWSASENQSVRTHRRQNPIFEEQRKLQSTQVKRTPQDFIRRLNPLVVVYFRFVYAFLHAQ